MTFHKNYSNLVLFDSIIEKHTNTVTKKLKMTDVKFTSFSLEIFDPGHNFNGMQLFNENWNKTVEFARSLLFK